MGLKDEKIAVLEQIKAKLECMLQSAETAAGSAQTEANHHIGAMQSRYDTFKEEAQYLAGAQKLRAATIAASIAACMTQIFAINKSCKNPSVVKLGACVRIRSDDGQITKNFFVVPDCAGDRVVMGGVEYTCVTIDAPAIRPFIGLSIGDYSDMVSSNDPLSEQYISEIL